MSSGGRAPASYLARRTLKPVSGSFSPINMRGRVIEPVCAHVSGAQTPPTVERQQTTMNMLVRVSIQSLSRSVSFIAAGACQVLQPLLRHQAVIRLSHVN